MAGEADRRRGERADADLAEHDVEGAARLLGCLGEDRRVAVRDPARDGIGGVVGDVGERRRAGRAGGFGRRRDGLLVVAVDAHDLGALGRDRVGSRLARARRQEDARREAALRGGTRDGATVVALAGRPHGAQPGLRGEQALERPGRAADLEGGQPEAPVLVLQQQLAEPERGGLAGQGAQRRRAHSRAARGGTRAPRARRGAPRARARARD